MTSILIVERTGEIKALNVKQFDRAELFKKAGFKVADGFDEQTTWTIPGLSQIISVFAKSKGRAGQENKYDFPPPVDTTLFFGNAVLVSWTDASKTTPKNLTPKEWEVAYEELFGGFEDLDDTAEADEEDLLRPDTPVLDETGDVVPVSKHGYLLDGFIVDDSDSLNSDGFETEEEEVVVAPKKKSKKAVKETEEEEPKPKKSKKAKKEVDNNSTDEATQPKKTKPRKSTKTTSDEQPAKKRATKKQSEPALPLPKVEVLPPLPPPPPTEELVEEEYFK